MVRSDGPAAHLKKMGTPTMGGPVGRPQGDEEQDGDVPDAEVQIPAGQEGDPHGKAHIRIAGQIPGEDRRDQEQ